MFVPETGTFEGFYLARFAQEGDKGERELVKVFYLDGLRAKGHIPEIDFVKCDVEGAELEVLQGSTDLIGSNHPCWLIEVSKEISKAVFQFMQSRGYKVFVYKNGISETDSFLDGEFSNYFFFHPQSKYWERAFSHMHLLSHD